MRLFVDLWLRQRLTPPVSSTFATRGEPAALQHAWVISRYPSDKTGRAVVPHIVQCPGGNPKACLAALDPGYMHAVYEPASRFWTMQLHEFGLFAGLAVLLIAFAAWWTDRRA